MNEQRWALAVAAVVPFAGPARAQVDEATREAARALGVEAVAAYEAENWALALEKFEQAHAALRAPSLALYSARCLVRLGRFVEAAARYHDAARTVIADEPADERREIQEQAQRDARVEREALMPRIPGLVLAVEGATGTTEVTIDGKVVPTALLGARYPVDPGPHEIRALSGDQQISQTIEVREGEERTVALRFEHDPSASSQALAPETGPVASGSPAPRPLPTRDRSEAGATARTLGFVGIGVGGAAIAFGAVTGALAIAKKSDLDDECFDGRCPPRLRDEADSLDRLRTFSTLGFAVGTVAVGAGIVLWATVPSNPEGTASVVLGPGQFELKGSF